jgi:hypothetical protein
MYNESEITLLKATGAFSTIAQYVYPGTNTSDNYGSFVLPGQCVAFLATKTQMTIWVESFDIEHAPENASPETPKATLVNKKLYPAKIEGLGLAYLRTETIRWREGLVNSKTTNQNLYFRPGYGELIPEDLSRPLKTTSLQRNDLGLGLSASANSVNFSCPLGRLMSVAFYIDPEVATNYDKSKKKQLNLNGDREDPPIYLNRTYTPASGGGGY